MSDSYQRLGHMIWAIDTLLSFDNSDLNNPMQYGATVYYLQIIGEAAKKVKREIQELAPEIPWHKMAALRNYVVHEYPFVDYTAIKDALVSLPTLREQLEALRHKITHDQGNP